MSPIFRHHIRDFLKHIENLHITHKTQKHKIITHFRYVDDILLTFDSNHTNIQAITTDFNTRHPNLYFTVERKTRRYNKLFRLFRTRNCTQQKNSHLQKNSLLQTLSSSTLPTILHNINIPQLDTYVADYTNSNYTRKNVIRKRTSSITSFIIILSQSKYGNLQILTNQMQISQTVVHKQKWATFTYIRKETTYITKIFKHTNIMIAYRTNNTIQDNLTPQTHSHNKFSATRVYKLTCPDCGKAYIGQRGRNFSQRYNEHKRAFRYNCHFFQICTTFK